MRPLGLTLIALLLGAAIIQAQQPVAGVPQAPPVIPAGAPAANRLDMHLDAWERAMGNTKNFRLEITLARTQAVFKRETKYSGVILCMKPNYAILRLNNMEDKSGADYIAGICNGKSFYDYNGKEKTITEHRLQQNQGGNPGMIVIDILSGMKSADAKKRFDINIFKEDENYVYLDIKPRLEQDKQDFLQLRMALYGPNTKAPYFPCQVYKYNPNGDTENWSFNNPQLNIPGIDADVFKFRPVKEFAFRVAPGGQDQAPGLRPGATGNQPGPIVRP